VVTVNNHGYTTGDRVAKTAVEVWEGEGGRSAEEAAAPLLT